MYSDRAIFGDNEKTSDCGVTPSTPVGVSLAQTQSGVMLSHANGLWLSESLDNRLQEHDAANISDKRVSWLGLVLMWNTSRVITDPGYLQGSLHQDREALHCLVSLRLLLFFQPFLVPLFERISSTLRRNLYNGKRSQVRGLTGTNLSLPDRLNAPWRSVGLSGRTVDGKENKVPQDCAKVNIHARRSVYEVPVASVRGWQQQLMGDSASLVPQQREVIAVETRQSLIAVETRQSLIAWRRKFFHPDRKLALLPAPP
ncbi:hypothetical protein RRG08_045123 [Elysia crispata]|uniref:Uncharacterized protein n=1 Tax=Elysia crispata TaxID=231223 RepID=A0AAE0YU99_9GAST|nr:hypothetical protein RRG08_045123 [Elysia crispata]